VSDIVPPSLGLSGAATQATPAGVAGTVTNPPQATTQLPSGAILHGTVMRLDGLHRALVRTDLGTLEVSSQAQLTLGSQVTLQVRSAGSRLHVVIMQIDGQPAHLPSATSEQTSGHGVTAASGQASGRGVRPPSGSAADVLALGQRLQAIVQSLPPELVDGQGKARAGALPAIGSHIQVRVRQVQPPGNQQSAPPAGPPQGVAATLTSKGATGPGRTIPAVVTGLTMSGEPVVETSLGRLTLGLKAALPIGTRLLLELTSPGFSQHHTAVVHAANYTALAFGWTALGEALELLKESDVPAARAPAVARSIPQPGPRLASMILFFLQALSGGDLRGWLGGRVVEALERADRGDLLPRLNRDFAQLARISESTGGDWRLLAVPLLEGSHIQQLRLFVRRRKHPLAGAEVESADMATRFILDVELSRFGDMQLDGLVRDQRFDLILRTRRQLSDEMRQEITAIFNDANSIAGHHGQISFQASGDWTFMPVESQGDSGAGLLA
jgi:hypothetical protein